MSSFIISTRKNGEYQFNLKADNGQVVLTSEGYNAKSGCLNGIESVRKNAADDKHYERKTSSNGKYYFNLKAANSQIIGTSEMYAEESGRENGIASVKKNAPAAVVEELKPQS